MTVPAATTPPAGESATLSNGVAPVTAPAAAGAGTDTPKWFIEHQAKVAENQAKVEARLSDMGKQFAKLKSKKPNAESVEPAEDDEPAEQTPQQIARAEMVSARKLGALLAKLPESAQAKLNEYVDNGGSYAEAISRAEFALTLVPEAPAGGKPAANVNGVAANAPPPNVATRWTQKTLGELGTKDPVKYNKVCDELEAQGLSLFSLPLA